MRKNREEGRVLLWGRRIALIAMLLLASGCVSVPVGSPLPVPCAEWKELQREPNCQDYLIVGFFPAVGEAHLNGLATNGRKLTLYGRVADYTIVPLMTVVVEVLTLVLPVFLISTVGEVFEDFDPAPGMCVLSIMGFCKGAKAIPDESTSKSSP